MPTAHFRDCFWNTNSKCDSSFRSARRIDPIDVAAALLFNRAAASTVVFWPEPTLAGVFHYGLA
jgi:hypothetical protein